MEVFWWTWLIFLVRSGQCYESICERTTCRAVQSSTRNGLSAEKVIDGNTDQKERNCSHTAEGQPEAWVMVDLRKEYMIKNILIYYRFDGNYSEAWKPFRFRQYRIEVSNSSGTQQWIQCYRDNTPDSQIPPSIQNISCKATTRYIRIITTYDAPEDNGFVAAGAILEICEVKVYGVTCSQNCINMQCDRDGNCSQGCNQGYWGNRCLNVCPSTCPMKVCKLQSGMCNSCNVGFFGTFCNMSCSENCAQSNCSQNGTCIGGCRPNWAGNRCDDCISNHYGPSCSKECSVNCIGQICNNVTGICTNGCKNGFYSEKCEERCSASCPSACNRYSGECEGECPLGKYGNQCDKTCNKYCKSVCSRTSGICDSGCISGRYGADCLRVCSSGCNSDCHQVDGSCVCKKGWQGQQCDECSHNRYGLQCDQECSPVCLNGTCFSNNGSCKEGCNINFHYGKVTQQSSENSTSNLSSTALYVVTVVLFLSVVLNIFFIVRNVRRNIRKRQNSQDVQKQQDPTHDLNTPTYDRVEDNAGYQELGQLSQPSQYEKLK